MKDYGDLIVNEQGQLFTPAGEPIWVTEDGRHIPLTNLKNDHLAAIQGMLGNDVTRWGPWVAYVDSEIARRVHQ